MKAQFIKLPDGKIVSPNLPNSWGEDNTKNTIQNFANIMGNHLEEMIKMAHEGSTPMQLIEVWMTVSREVSENMEPEPPGKF